jgi:hypothetical protein
MSTTVTKVLKVGGGPIVMGGTAIRVHLKFAFHVADFENDGHVVGSTLESTTPRLLRMDPAVLRPEIYSSLLGVAEGSEIAVSISDVLNDDGESLLVFIWVEKVQDVAAAERIIVTAVKVGMPELVLELIDQAVAAGKRQAQGFVIQVAVSAHQDLLDLIEQLHREIGGSEPYRMPSGKDGATVSYLLGSALYDSLADRVTTLRSGAA